MEADALTSVEAGHSGGKWCMQIIIATSHRTRGSLLLLVSYHHMVLDDVSSFRPRQSLSRHPSYQNGSECQHYRCPYCECRCPVKRLANGPICVPSFCEG